MLCGVNVVNACARKRRIIIRMCCERCCKVEARPGLKKLFVLPDARGAANLPRHLKRCQSGFFLFFSHLDVSEPK